MIRFPGLAIGVAMIIVGANFAHAQAASDASTVVASRGGVHVTLGDIDEYLQHVPAEKRAGMMDSPKRIEAVLLNMLVNEQLAKQAEQMQLDRDPEAKGKTGWARVEVLSRLRMKQFMKDIKLPDFEVLAKEEYVGHKAKYSTPGPVAVQRIFISTKDKDSAEVWKHADAVRTEALAAPDQFDALVAKYSEDPDKAETHGMITDAYQHKSDKLFMTAVVPLQKPGDISAVCLAADGFQIIKLVSMAPATAQPFADVHDQIVKELKENFISTQRSNFIDGLNSEKLDANPEVVASLRTRYQPRFPQPAAAQAEPAHPAP
jgi:peptidyl-prolyl cis-trans isomerase C